MNKSLVKKMLFESYNLDEFVKKLNIVKSSKDDSYCMFMASLNAKRLLNEINTGFRNKNNYTRFVVYNNDEVNVYDGNKNDIQFFKERFNWVFKEFKRK